MLSKNGKYGYIYHGLLSEKEIEVILKKYNHDDSYNIRFNKKSYRKCDKMVIFDKKLTNLVWNKLKEF